MTKIRYKDITFKTVADAAIYFGVTSSNIHYHLKKHGHLDRVGTVDTSQHKPITIRGVYYHSHTDAANKLGVARTTIREANDGGYLETVGTVPKGRGQRNRVKIRGVVYETQTIAAKALNVSNGAISNALKRGTVERVGLGLHLQTRKQPKPITVRNVRYRSRQEAANALHISTWQLRRLEKDGELDKAGLSGLVNGCRPLEYKGQRYKSQTALANHLGVSKATVNYAVRANKVHQLKEKRNVN